MIIMLSPTAKQYARVYFKSHLSVSWSAPSGCQLIGQAANLSFWVCL